MSMAIIFVKLEAVGFHHWPDAPGHRDYLRHKHRHLFHLEARTAVGHDDREIEFHDVRDELGRLWLGMAGLGGDLGKMSCEAMARRLCAGLAALWPRTWQVSVSEDGEAGAVVRIEVDD